MDNMILMRCMFIYEKFINFIILWLKWEINEEGLYHLYYVWYFIYYSFLASDEKHEHVFYTCMLKQIN